MIIDMHAEILHIQDDDIAIFQPLDFDIRQVCLIERHLTKDVSEFVNVSDYEVIDDHHILCTLVLECYDHSLLTKMHINTYESITNFIKLRDILCTADLSKAALAMQQAVTESAPNAERSQVTPSQQQKLQYELRNVNGDINAKPPKEFEDYARAVITAYNEIISANPDLEQSCFSRVKLGDKDVN